jgi:DNA-binding beta-propeller fold protein YncE
VLFMSTADNARAQLASYALVPSDSAGSLDMFDVATGVRVSGAPFTLAQSARCATPSADGRFAYVTMGADVARVDLATGAVVATIHVGGALSCAAVTTDGTKAYVSDTPNDRVVTTAPGSWLAIRWGT